jgi:hypothetical protein
LSPTISAPSKRKRVDRRGKLGAHAQASRQTKSLFLERHGDIGAAATGGDKSPHAGGETVDRRQQCLVAEVLPALRGKGRVDQRRLAVADGIAENAI